MSIDLAFGEAVEELPPGKLLFAFFIVLMGIIGCLIC